VLSMANIGGNIVGTIQAASTGARNEIGEAVQAWADVYGIRGWLSLQNGDSKYSNYRAKLEESTHVFLSDYHKGVYSLAAQNTRMVIKGFVYDVLLIDNPDERNEQLEIYLKRVGAWNGEA